MGLLSSPSCALGMLCLTPERAPFSDPHDGDVVDCQQTCLSTSRDKPQAESHPLLSLHLRVALLGPVERRSGHLGG